MGARKDKKPLQKCLDYLRLLRFWKAMQAKIRKLFFIYKSDMENPNKDNNINLLLILVLIATIFILGYNFGCKLMAMFD